MAQILRPWRVSLNLKGLTDLRTLHVPELRKLLKSCYNTTLLHVGHTLLSWKNKTDNQCATVKGSFYKHRGILLLNQTRH